MLATVREEEREREGGRGREGEIEACWREVDEGTHSACFLFQTVFCHVSLCVQLDFFTS